MSNLDDMTMIGTEEWCSFPSLGIPAIHARVDSGAATSSIHAEHIQAFIRDGQPWVSFEVHPLRNKRSTTVRCEAPVYDKRLVKSSNGSTERRYVIRVPLEIGSHHYDIELTLTNRAGMSYRMLLGREAMQERFLVNPGVENAMGEYTREELEDIYGFKARKKTGLKIGLLASNPDLYSNQRIMEAGRAAGHEMVFLNIKHCYMKMDAENPEVHYRGGRILSDFDAIIPRIRPSMTFYGCALVRHFESIKSYALNGSEAITQSRDKLFSLQLLQQNGLDIPTTGFANSPIDTNDLIEMVNGAPLIVKLLEGTQGRGVVLAETKKAAESVINAFKALNANLLVQEFIKEADGKDLRCFVIRNKVVASMMRSAAPGEFRANIHQGGSASIVKITPEERRLAIQAAKTMGLDVAGVDIIRSKKGPLLLEINSSPGLEGIENATQKDIAGMMINAIEKKLRFNRAAMETTAE